MSIWTSVRDRLVLSRANDEALHAAAHQEYQSGRRRDGLWAKALISSEGDPCRTEAAYLALLVAALKDELYLMARATKFSELPSNQDAPEASQSPATAKSEHSLAAQLVIAGRASFKHYEILLRHCGGSLASVSGFFRSYYVVAYQGRVDNLSTLEDLQTWALQHLSLEALAGQS